jgi:hypothetical protein
LFAGWFGSFDFAPAVGLLTTYLFFNGVRDSLRLIVWLGAKANVPNSVGKRNFQKCEGGGFLFSFFVPRCPR